MSGGRSIALMPPYRLPDSIRSQHTVCPRILALRATARTAIRAVMPMCVSQSSSQPTRALISQGSPGRSRSAMYPGGIVASSAMELFVARA